MLSNKNKYIGEWKNGKKNGVGTFTYASGGKYIGEWQHNRKHGRGTYRFIDGTAVHAVYEDGNRVGKGVFTYGRGNRCGKVDLDFCGARWRRLGTVCLNKIE